MLLRYYSKYFELESIARDLAVFRILSWNCEYNAFMRAQMSLWRHNSGPFYVKAESPMLLRVVSVLSQSPSIYLSASRFWEKGSTSPSNPQTHISMILCAAVRAYIYPRELSWRNHENWITIPGTGRNRYINRLDTDLWTWYYNEGDKYLHRNKISPPPCRFFATITVFHAHNDSETR